MDMQGVASYTGTTTVNDGTFKAMQLAGPLVVNDGGTVAVSGVQIGSLTVPAASLDNSGGTSPTTLTLRVAIGLSDLVNITGTIGGSGTSALQAVQTSGGTLSTSNSYTLMTFGGGSVPALVGGLGYGDYDFSNIHASSGSVTAQLAYNPNQWIGSGAGAWSTAGSWSKGEVFIPDNGFNANFLSLARRRGPRFHQPHRGRDELQ